ncbi:hypothetical protein C0J52_21706 [Blattella germanica]|nr:hypothetical protein C0J52_21706 [Blattella germanica]
MFGSSFVDSYSSRNRQIKNETSSLPHTITLILPSSYHSVSLIFDTTIWFTVFFALTE